MQKLAVIAMLVAVVAARNYGGAQSGGFARGGFKSVQQQPIQQQYEDAPAPSYATAGGARSPARARQQQQEEEQHPAPEPYSFAFETTDEYGVTLTRTESGDQAGNVKGSYMYRDANGLYRTVEYGDNGNGFQASIQTNEPGVVSHKSADAEYIKE